MLSVLGGVGGSIAMLAYNYWMREEGMAGREWLSFVRRDITIAYVFTAVFAVAIMVVATAAFHVPGVAITNAQAVTRMAETLDDTIGVAGFYAYAIGFWAAVFASLLGVWQSVPYLFADYYGLLRGYAPAARADLTTATSPPYRLALLFITVVSLPFAFVDQPLFIIRTFTIVGSLFIPFLAGTLLYLNNVKLPAASGVPEEHRAEQRRAGAGAGRVRRGRPVRGWVVRTMSDKTPRPRTGAAGARARSGRPALHAGCTGDMLAPPAHPPPRRAPTC